jgi:hypothetical protein
MGDLRRLCLYDSPVTDIGMVHINKLKSLELLAIAGTQVTDRGLSILSSPPSANANVQTRQKANGL